MSDTTAPLDPQRPWITDPADLPSNMNWFATLFWPVGRSGKLHFTRAWTLLFMSRAILVFALVMIPLILALAGAQAGGVQGVIFAALAVTIIVTELASFMLHNRRMRDAGKSGFWAMIVLVPAILAFASIATMTPGLIKAHDTLIAEQEASKTEEGEEASGDNAQASQQSGTNTRRGSRDGFGRDGPPSQQAFVTSRIMPVAGAIWLLGSFFVMLWTLLWVARQPSVPKY